MVGMITDDNIPLPLDTGAMLCASYMMKDALLELQKFDWEHPESLPIALRNHPKALSEALETIGLQQGFLDILSQGAPKLETLYGYIARMSMENPVPAQRFAVRQCLEAGRKDVLEKVAANEKLFWSVRMDAKASIKLLELVEERKTDRVVAYLEEYGGTDTDIGISLLRRCKNIGWDAPVKDFLAVVDWAEKKPAGKPVYISPTIKNFAKKTLAEMRSSGISPPKGNNVIATDTRIKR